MGRPFENMSTAKTLGAAITAPINLPSEIAKQIADATERALQIGSHSHRLQSFLIGPRPEPSSVETAEREPLGIFECFHHQLQRLNNILDENQRVLDCLREEIGA